MVQLENILVYCGPTLSGAEVEEALPGVRTAPPVKRGDLIKHRAEGVEVFVMIDGVFLQSAAVAASEVVDVVNSGAVIIGASSMGALRSAECWPVGVIPVGLVSRLYRMGVLTTDDEVAVATDETRDYVATTTALINVRYACSMAVRRQLLSPAEAAALVVVAEKQHFTQRLWSVLFKLASKAHGAPIFLPDDFLHQHDIKRKDAYRALQYCRQLHENDALETVPGPAQVHLRTRYRGKDRTYGMGDEIDKRLLHWLIASGRYTRYAWRHLVGHVPEGKDLTPDEQQDLLFSHMKDVCSDLGNHYQRWVNVLHAEAEYEAEVMQLVAIRQLAELGRLASLKPEPYSLAAKEEVAIAHGAYTWGLLADSAAEEDGLIMGAIPLVWAEQAAEQIALSRAWIALAKKDLKRTASGSR